MNAPLILGLGAPEVTGDDVDLGVVIGSVALHEDGSLAVVLEQGDDTVTLAWPREAVSPALLAWFEARSVAA